MRPQSREQEVLLEISYDGDELVREFLDQWDEAMIQPMNYALEMWALKRFHAAPCPAALGILNFAAKQAVRMGLPDQRRAKVPPREPSEGTLAYVERIAVLNGWMACGKEPAKPMPRTPGEEG